MTQCKIKTRSFFIVLATVLMFAMASVAFAAEVSNIPVEDITSTTEEVSNLPVENVVPTSADDVIYEKGEFMEGTVYWGGSCPVKDAGNYKVFYAVDSSLASTHIEFKVDGRTVKAADGRLSGMITVSKGANSTIGLGVLLNTTAKTYVMISIEKA